MWPSVHPFIHIIHPLHVRWSQVSHLPHAWPPTLLERKKNTGKSFFHYILMSTLAWISQKELVGEIKNKLKKNNFAGRITWKFNSCSSEKMRNASGQQDEKWAAVKKRRSRNTSNKIFCEEYNIFSMKRVTKKFHVLVMQNNDKELCTKSVLHMQSLFFFAIVSLFFLPFSLPSLFSITWFYFLLAKVY